MSPPSVLPPLLLLFAAASAGPLDLPDEGTAAPGSTFLPPSLAAAAAAANAATSTAGPAPGPGPEERAVPAATIAPPADGQYCTVAGAVFHNGARLPASADPDPCRACYCQAGESVCTRVHCYRRPDCAPRHVPGSCCPKYDSCPPVQEERSPEPRVRDAATQTDAVPTAPTASATTLPTTTAADASSTITVTTTTTQEVTEATETTAATTVTATDSTSTLASTTTTTAAMGSTTVTSSAEPPTSTTVEDDGEESGEAAATSNYPPGIDLYALHEHLPFLSPGDANGPNT